MIYMNKFSLFISIAKFFDRVYLWSSVVHVNGINMQLE
jgi:hypothetical protein